MAWRLTRNELREYPRNPLVAVVGQLRFHPILKIGRGQHIEDFQDRIRHRFPLFSEEEQHSVRILPDGIESRRERRFQFLTTDKSLKLSLGETSLSLESRDHRSHREFIEDFDLAACALKAVFEPINSTRLGLRYVNVLDRKAIGKDLGEDVDWSDLVVEDFLRLPPGVDLEQTFFSTEITSSLNDGKLTLRYGLPNAKDKETTYRFDLDRYSESSIAPEGCKTLLRDFAKDIYDVFMNMPGKSLLKWMNK
ncbi:MAG: TIGR04255 family protein [Ectothiorhodospiraceae bacterium]|nr:TIGR04255 family protein [Ectothiorhodospiraceae bacterium]